MKEANRPHGSLDHELDSEESESIGEGGGRDSDLDIESDSEEEGEQRRDEDLKDLPMLNEDTLLQIKNNDPKLTSIYVRNFDHCIDGADAGYYIGQNSQLKRLSVKGEFMGWDEEFLKTTCLLGRFAKGLTQNRSIEALMLSCCDFSLGSISVTNPKIQKLQKHTVVRLASFCEKNVKLKSIKIDCCDLGSKTARVLAMVLGRKVDKSSLQRINLTTNEIGDVAAKELIESLKGYDNLVELDLGSNSLGSKACAALDEMISSPATELRELNLQNNDIDDEGIATLTKAFADNVTLVEVNLGLNPKVTPSGWQIFFTCLRNSPTSIGFLDFVTCLSSSSIETLNIGQNNITDKVLATLGDALANNATLRALDFSSNVRRPNSITAAGWRSFFDCLQGSKSALQEVTFRGCGINEEELAVVANAMNNDSRFVMLDLSDNPQLNIAAWRHFFATCFQSPKSSLEGIFLCKNFWEGADELMADLAGALAYNKTLEALDLSENPSISEAGWSHFPHHLCNKSSIDSMYESNHTLNYLGSQELPPELETLLNLNENDKREVARQKILRYQLVHGDTHMQEFLKMKVEVLPNAISWLGRHRSWTGPKKNGHSPLYHLLRSMPSLFASKQTAQAAGVKRKQKSQEVAL